MQQEHDGDDMLHVVIPRILVAQKAKDLFRLRDVLAEVAEALRKGLEPSVIVVDGHVTLFQGAEFGL